MDDAQLLVLRTHIQANTTVLSFGGGSATIANTFNAATLGSGDAAIIADWYKLTASPDYFIIRQDASVKAIRNAIMWPRYTPAPTVSGANAAQHTACSNLCMNKSQNLIAILGPSTDGKFDATQASLTNGIKDATTVLPTGAAFANQDAGWVPLSGSPGLSNQLVRKATNLERAFVAVSTVTALDDGVSARGAWNTGTGLGKPDVATVYGETISGDLVSHIKGLPA